MRCFIELAENKATGHKIISYCLGNPCLYCQSLQELQAMGFGLSLVIGLRYMSGHNYETGLTFIMRTMVFKAIITIIKYSNGGETTNRHILY